MACTCPCTCGGRDNVVADISYMGLEHESYLEPMQSSRTAYHIEQKKDGAYKLISSQMIQYKKMKLLQDSLVFYNKQKNEKIEISGGNYSCNKDSATFDYYLLVRSARGTGQVDWIFEEEAQYKLC